MSAKAIARSVKWLSGGGNSDTLSESQGLIYVGFKLGMTHPGTHAGLTPQKAFETRYKGQQSSLSEDFVADVLVYESDQKHADHDDIIRGIIHKKYLSGDIPFSAYYPKGNPAPEGVNGEAFIDYDQYRDLDIVTDIVVDYFTNGVRNISVPWVPRDQGTPYAQDLPVNEILEIYEHSDQAAFNGHTGFAKTMIAAAVINSLYDEGCFVLFTTPISDTLTDVRSNFEDFIYTNPRLGDAVRYRKTKVYTVDDLNHITISEMREQADQGDIVVLALTVQNTRYQDSGSLSLDDDVDIRDKFSDLSCVTVDHWIRDEVHKEYGGSVTQRVFAQINTHRIFDLSASINKIRDRYHYDQICDRGLFWALEHQEDRGTPRIHIEALDGAVYENLTDSDQELYDEELGWLPSKMTEILDNGVLKCHRVFDNFLDRMYIQDDDKEDNPLSIIYDNDLPEISKKVGIHVLPQGVKGVSADEYITKLARDLNESPKWNQGKAVFITPYDYQMHRNPVEGINTPAEIVKDLITSFEHVIILTHRMWTTGSNIPPIGHCVLWDRISDPYLLEQLFPGRAFRVLTGKTDIKLICLHPGTSVSDNFCRVAKQTAMVRSTRDSTVHATELLKMINFKKYDGVDMVTVDPVELFQDFNKKITERINRCINADQIEDAIRGTSVEDILNGVNLSNKILGGTSTFELTGDNGAKKSITKSGSERKVSQRSINVAKKINAMMIEVPPFVIVNQITTVEDALNQTEIRDMFGTDVVEAVLEALSDAPKLRLLLQNKIDEYHQALGLMSFIEVHDYIFVNTQRKKDAGLVFINIEAAEFMAKEQIAKQNIPEDYDGEVAVVNALSGSVPTILTKLLPNAKIVCVERYTYYNDLLRSMGFEVKELKEVKNIKYWFLNPPYQKDAGGKKDNDNKQGSFWWPFIERPLTTEASTSDAKFFVVSPKSIFGAGGFGAKSYKVSQIKQAGAEFTHIYPDVTNFFPGIGIEICGWCIEKGKQTTDCTVEGYNEVIDIAGNSPVPFFVSPTAMSVVNKCYTPNNIPFVEKLDASDTDAVIRVNGGRWKEYKKIFVGMNSDTTHNQQGAIISKNDLPGYESAIASDLWKFMFKVLGGEKGNSVTGFMKCMPVMEDMTRSYTNAEWFKAFGITASEQQKISEVLNELS